MLPKLLGEFGHARGCSGSQNTVVLVEYGGYMVAIRWNMVEYGGIVWQDQYVICDRLSQLLLFGRSFWKGNFLVFPRFWTETRQKWSQRLLVVSCFSYSIPLWDHDYSNQEDSAYRTNMKQQMPQPLFWKKNRCCVASISSQGAAWDHFICLTAVKQDWRAMQFVVPQLQGWRERSNPKGRIGWSGFSRNISELNGTKWNKSPFFTIHLPSFTHLNPLICHTFTMIYRYESMIYAVFCG